MEKEASGRSKKEQVESMFDSIAWRYDFLNHFLSLGIDRLWRRKAVGIIGRHAINPEVLDVATGTADLAIAVMKLDPVSVKGVDISTNMLEIGRRKVKAKNLESTIKLLEGDSENLAFPDSSFDVAMAAFGVRNFADPLKGLKEMNRVLREGGFIMVLEFSRPSSFPFRNIYNFYFLRILPFVGRFFSRDRSAYTYLPESVMRFPDNEEFLALLRSAGFASAEQVKLSGGIASIYTGIKPRGQ